MPDEDRSQRKVRIMFVATINVPGYLPMDDEPPTFETAREAWEYLADERDRELDSAADAMETDEQRATLDDDETLAELRKHATWAASGLVCDFEAVGTVYGATPGYDGSHDLGLAYSVTETEE